jgi:hypothetical protein
MLRIGLPVASKIKFTLALLITVLGCSARQESTCHYANNLYIIRDSGLSISIGNIPDIHGDYSMTFKGSNLKMAVKLSNVSAKKESGFLLLENKYFPKPIIIKENECQDGIYDLIAKAKDVVVN